MAFYSIEPRDNPTSKETSMFFSDKSSASVYTTDTADTRIATTVDSINPDNIPAALERTFFNSIAEGKNTLAVSEDLAEYAERVATNAMADFTIENGEAKITANDKTTQSNNDTIRAALVAYNATQAGLKAEDIMQKFKDTGFTDIEIDSAFKRMEVVGRAVSSGMTIEDVENRMRALANTVEEVRTEPAKVSFLDKLVVKAATELTAKSAYLFDVLNPNVEMTPEQLVSSLKVIKPTMVSDSITTTSAFFGNREAQQRYDQARESSRQKIIDLAQTKYGVDLIWQGEEVGAERWYVEGEEGLEEVTPGFFEDLKKYSGEIGGGITGAIVGFRAGAAAGPYGALAGGALGSWIGASAGSQVDYLYQAMKLQEEMEAEAMAYRALNAFEAAAIGEAVGTAAIKSMGIAWRGVVQAKDLIVNGEARRGYAALKEATGFTDDQVEDIVAAFERYAPLSGSKQEKGIAAIALTQPSMQPLVAAAAGTRQGVIPSVRSAVQKRTDAILEEASKISENHSPETLVKDLRNYTMDVKEAYGRVKAQATQSPKGLDFEWDFKEVAIEPVMDSLLGKITDPVTRERFILQMQRVNSLSESNNFSDLIELRQIVNDFLYNKRVVKADDQKAIRGVINNIDDAIEQGAVSVMDNPKQWLQDWSDVRKEYANMKQIERTALYRSIFDAKGNLKSVKPETIVNSLGRYIDALDGSFEDVMQKLPAKGRGQYEAAVLKRTIEKNTAVTEGVDVINFGSLADDLNRISFTTNDSRALKQAIIEMSEVFKNDPSLANLRPNVSLPSFQSYLTTDPRKRLEYGAASSIFGYISSKAPTETGRRYALVRSAAKVLENPLDFKAMEHLTSEVYDDVNLTRQLLQLRQEAARDKAAGKDTGAAMVKIYEGGKLKGSNATGSIPAHRILTLDQAKQIAETEYMTLNSKALDDVLVKYGYKAIMDGSDRVRVLGGK